MSIAISVTDAQKYGCPHCNYRSHSQHISGQGASVCSCGDCHQGFIVLLEGITVSPFGTSSDSEGKTEYSKIQEHPRKHALARGREDIRPNEGEYFSPRGVGTDYTNGCMFCNKEDISVSNNVSGFVRTKEAGLRLLEKFKYAPENGNELTRIGARLDYRENYPDRIQFKVGSCDSCLKNLELLEYYTSLTGTITNQYINLARAMLLPTLLFSVHNYVGFEKETSNKYFSEDTTNDYQRGRLASYRQIKAWLEKCSDDTFVTPFMQSMLPVLKEAQTEYDLDNKNHYQRGKLGAFEELQSFILRFPYKNS